MSSFLQLATYSLMDILRHRADDLVSTCRNRGSKGGLIDWNLGGCAMGFFSIGSGFFEDKTRMMLSLSTKQVAQFSS